ERLAPAPHDCPRRGPLGCEHGPPADELLALVGHDALVAELDGLLALLEDGDSRVVGHHVGLELGEDEGRDVAEEEVYCQLAEEVVYKAGTEVSCLAKLR